MLKDNLERLIYAANSPRAMMESYLAAGKKVAGCIPEYTPEVIVHAAGFVPFGMWGGETTIKLADSYIPTFACSLVRSCAELGLNGSYKGLSFIIAPILCDALKGCVQTFRVAVCAPPIIPFSLPQNRAMSASVDFVVGEYEMLCNKIEKLTGTHISTAALSNSIRIYNQHNSAMRCFDKVAAEHTDIITAELRESVFKSAWFMDKEEHTAIVNEILAELKILPICKKSEIRAILTGVTAGSMALMKIFDEEGIDIVGDQVYQGSWSYRCDMSEGADSPINAIAEHWLQIGGSCVVHEEHRSRAEAVKELLSNRDANAVFITLMKFCDPEEYETPLLKAELKQSCNVQILDIDQNANNLEQLRTRIQSFKELFF